MFSSNDKISSRQIKRLLVFDMFGAGSLLLPSQLAMSGNGIGIWSILAGMFFAGAYLWMLRICASRTPSDYLNYLKTGWGNILSRLCYLCYALISIVACAWAAKILTQLVCDSLLDSVDFGTALFVIMLLAYYGASAGVEARARVYEILFWVLVIPLVVMLLLCVRQVQVIQWFPLLGEQDAISWSWFFIGTWRCFATFLPLTFLLFLLPHVQDKRKSQRAAGWAVLLNGLALVCVYLVLLGIFGSGALAKEQYPVITLMGMVKIPGEFLKRMNRTWLGQHPAEAAHKRQSVPRGRRIRGRARASGCTGRGRISGFCWQQPLHTGSHTRFICGRRYRFRLWRCFIWSVCRSRCLFL